ncbi:MAG: hypothetical protein ACXAC6_07295 [Candidatus Hodarchaeales archaeon]|jgi:hypothetical protein
MLMQTSESLDELKAKPWTSAYELQQIRRYKFGVPSLDALNPSGMLPGNLFLLQGNVNRKLLRLLITNLSIGLLTANEPAEVAFVDGANIFPYYEISAEARKRGYDPLVILDRIQVARAFNYHQITEIITNRLPALLKAKPDLKIVLIPQISSQYFSEEALQYLEYARLSPGEGSISELTYAVGTIKSLALEHNLIVIMTADSADNSQTKGLGGTYLSHSASTVIRIASSASSIKEYDIHFSLQKDPARPVTSLKHSHRKKKPVDNQMLINRYFKYW